MVPLADEDVPLVQNDDLSLLSSQQNQWLHGRPYSIRGFRVNWSQKFHHGRSCMIALLTQIYIIKPLKSLMSASQTHSHGSAQAHNSKTIRATIKKEITDELILPHLLGSDGPKRQLLFKVFDTTKGPDDKANRRNISNVIDAHVRFLAYRSTDIHLEPHNLGVGTGTGRDYTMSLVREHDPSFDGTSDAPQPRPYCFGCSSFFHPFSSDNFHSVLPLKRFSSEGGNMKACSRCKVVTYCSHECQVKDWDGKVKDNWYGKRFVSHRKICKALVKDVDASVQIIVSDQSLSPTAESNTSQIDMYRQRLKTWVKHHHEQILVMARKALDKPVFESLPEVNVTVITLREDDLQSPYGSIANEVRAISPQPEIVYLPNILFNTQILNAAPTPSHQQILLAQFRFQGSIFHIVRIMRTGLHILHDYLQNHTISGPKNTPNPEFDPQELINIGYHPVIFMANLSQGGKVVHLEHVKISEIMDCDDLDYFTIDRLVALTNRGNLSTLKHTRKNLEE